MQQNKFLAWAGSEGAGRAPGAPRAPSPSPWAAPGPGGSEPAGAEPRTAARGSLLLFKSLHDQRLH